VSKAVAGSGKCKVADYVITGCGVQPLSLKQGVTFCFKNVNFLFLCTDIDSTGTVPYCASPTNGLSILSFAASGSLSAQCSANPPYYGALTTSF
jgi:hypothetical protein